MGNRRISDDIKTTALSLLDMGHTPKEVAALLFISARSVQRWGANWRDHMSFYKVISLVI